MNISDVEKKTGLPSTAIRYYEGRGLISVKRKENGYRDYDEKSVELLLKIRLFRELEIPLSDIRLWRDGVLSENELIAKRLRTLDDDGKKSRDRRAICEALLRGEYRSESPPFSDAFHEEDTAETVVFDCPLLLGIDIGTTTISAQVVASDSGTTVQTYNFDHNAALVLEDYPDAFAADAEKLIGRAMALVASVVDTYPTIASIGITGQMHGVIAIDEAGKILSPLYTWQNQFGQRRLDGGKTVCEEIRDICGESIPTGYGITTCYALKKLGILPGQTAKMVTVSDLFAAYLTGTSPKLHATNAAAMGAFDLTMNCFKREILECLGISPSFLPELLCDYSVVGQYTAKGRSMPVAVAIGDNQAGMFGSLSGECSVLVNVGTGSQVSIVTDDPTPFHEGEVRPYFDGLFIRSGAALCGGGAYAMLKDLVRSVIADFGVTVSDRLVYDYLNRMAEIGMPSPLSVKTTFSGTRADPSQKGEIQEISLRNFTPATLSAGILRGIAEELFGMYSSMHPKRDTAAIVASGNAVRKNPALQRTLAEVFGIRPLIPCHTEEAAFGAALFGGVSAGLLTREDSYHRVRY